MKVPTPKEVQTKDDSSSSEDFSSGEENLEDKNENIKVFKNGVEMTTWHCDVCKCIFLDQVSKITLCIKVIMMSFPELSTLHKVYLGWQLTLRHSDQTPQMSQHQLSPF